MFVECNISLYILTWQIPLKMLHPRNPPNRDTPIPHVQIQIQLKSQLIQIQLKSQFEFVMRDIAESELLDLVDFGVVEFSVETVIRNISL